MAPMRTASLRSTLYALRVVVLFAFSLQWLLGQQALGPEDAVRLALENNQFLVAGAHNVAAAQGLELQAGLKPNSRMVLQVENARIPLGTPLVYSRDTDNFAYAQRVFEVGGKRNRRVELARETTESAKRALAVHRMQLASQVLTAYWRAVGAQRSVEAIQGTRDLLKKIVDYQRNRVEAGASAEVDLIRVQLEYQQIAISHANAVQNAKQQLQMLYRTMGVTPNLHVVLSGDLEDMQQAPDIDFNAALDRRADVQLARKIVHQREASLRLQQANAIPDPELVLGYKRTAGLNAAIVGIQINLPFHNRNQGAIAAAASEVAAAHAELRAIEIAAHTEIETALAEYQQKENLLSEMIPPLRQHSNETSRIADAVYREGASDVLRLLDAQRARIQTETLYIQSLLDFRQAAINLDAALGLLP